MTETKAGVQKIDLCNLRREDVPGLLKRLNVRAERLARAVVDPNQPKFLLDELRMAVIDSASDLCAVRGAMEQPTKRRAD